MPILGAVLLLEPFLASAAPPWASFSFLCIWPGYHAARYMSVHTLPLRSTMPCLQLRPQMVEGMVSFLVQQAAADKQQKQPKVLQAQQRQEHAASGLPEHCADRPAPPPGAAAQPPRTPSIPAAAAATAPAGAGPAAGVQASTPGAGEQGGALAAVPLAADHGSQALGVDDKHNDDNDENYALAGSGPCWVLGSGQKESKAKPPSAPPPPAPAAPADPEAVRDGGGRARLACCVFLSQAAL